MEIEGRNVWQIAAGDSDRNYAEWLLDRNVVMVGPGDRGKWPECEDLLKEDGWKGKKIGDIRRFAKDITPGDIVVLRIGTSDICGVGVMGDYGWNEHFSDIDGWDLQHYRPVNWFWKKIGDYPPQPQFDAYALKFGSTTQRMTSDAILEWINEIMPSGLPEVVEPFEFPNEISKETKPSEIGTHLFEHGVGSDSVKALLNRIDELIGLARWYRQSNGLPSEHETVSYLVLPLLRALGWPPQKMGVEWNRMDVALFDRVPRDDATLSALVEAKKLNSSCLSARSQAEDYANKDGRNHCQRLIVTDGIRYGVFSRGKEGGFPTIPTAYLNLTRLQKNYPIFNCKGAAHAIEMMTPDWEEGRS